ncbi:stage III sporulation protein AG [Lachnospiraceae bacterium MD308]|nr:stage III sporulation protein AG [Lachnospiraceae bacterium MD308]MCI8580871.1 stage III sporulation protein AG [Dorea sp.]
MLKGRRIKKDQIVILFLLGVLLLVIALPDGNREQENEMDVQTGDENVIASGSRSEEEYVSYMEKNLERILAQMKGVGEVTVMITLKESAEKVVEKDVSTTSDTVDEEDSQGGVRKTENDSRGETTVYFGDGGSGGLRGSSYEGAGQNPYVSKELTPRVEGVVVVAGGGDDAVVVKNITESVQALFGIDTHKIRIVKKE